MQMEYRCSKPECSRPAELKKVSIERTHNGFLMINKVPNNRCYSCGSEIKLLQV